MKESQKGLTLIEVLVSIVLLSIILISFISFFTQSSFFAQKNQQKLDTMQMAQKIIDLVEISISKQDLQDSFIIDSSNNVINGTKNLTKSDIQGLLDDPLDPNYNISAVISNTDIPNSTEKLILFKIIVQDPNSFNKSETYTYIRR